jgi:replication-associated recombination protein RarA
MRAAGAGRPAIADLTARQKMPKYHLAGFSTQALLDELTHRVKCTEKKEVTRTILLGPPGCGKGTQSPSLK